MEHQELVTKLHNQGFNCAQSFICAYKDELKMDEKMLFTLVEGLGRGIAGLEDICCIPVIMTMICSKLETCDGELSNPNSKLDTYACGKCLIMDFKEKVGTIRCHDILEYNKKSNNRCCTDILKKGAKIMDQYLNE